MRANTDTTIRLATGKILAAFSVTEDIKKIRISHRQTAECALPGQFINIKTSDSLFPLLRRPFSINRTNPAQGWFEILFRVVGAGTNALAQLKIDSDIDFVGPLGNSFSLPNKSQNSVLVAGGLGIAPLEFLAQKLTEEKLSAHLFWGNQSSEAFSYQKQFSRLNLKTFFATDDGSLGFRGNVVTLLERELAALKDENICIYACGPNPMLRALQNFAAAKNLTCQVSLETMMACGFGACMGCNVEKADGSGYFYVCQDGPVFDIKEIRIYG